MVLCDGSLRGLKYNYDAANLIKISDDNIVNLGGSRKFIYRVGYAIS